MKYLDFTPARELYDRLTYVRLLQGFAAAPVVAFAMYVWIAGVQLPGFWTVVMSLGVGAASGELLARAALFFRTGGTAQTFKAVGLAALAMILMFGVKSETHASGLILLGLFLGGAAYFGHLIETIWRKKLAGSLLHAGQLLFHAEDLAPAFHESRAAVTTGADEVAALTAPAVALTVEEPHYDSRVNPFEHTEADVEEAVVSTPVELAVERPVFAAPVIEAAPVAANEPAAKVVITHHATTSEHGPIIVVAANGLTNSQLDKADGLFKLAQKVPGVSFLKVNNLGNGRKELVLKLAGESAQSVAAIEAIVAKDERFQGTAS